MKDKYMDPRWIYGSETDDIEMVALGKLVVGDVVWHNHTWYKLTRLEQTYTGENEDEPMFMSISLDEITINGKRLSYSYDNSSKDPVRYFVRMVK